MKILVFSDTHMDISHMITVIKRNLNDIALVVHLGDNVCDAQVAAALFPNVPFKFVLGNCDYTDGIPAISIFNMLGKCFLLTHGHKEYVKASLDVLKAISIQNAADIVLYGHTHIAHYEEYNNIKFLCPGTCRPHNTQISTFGTIEFDKTDVFVYYSQFID